MAVSYSLGDQPVKGPTAGSAFAPIDWLVEAPLVVWYFANLTVAAGDVPSCCLTPSLSAQSQSLCSGCDDETRQNASLLARVAMLMLRGLGAHLHVDIVGHDGEPHHNVHIDGSLAGDHASTQHDAYFDISLLEAAPAPPGLDLALPTLIQNLELPGVAALLASLITILTWMGGRPNPGATDCLNISAGRKTGTWQPSSRAALDQNKSRGPGLGSRLCRGP